LYKLLERSLVTDKRLDAGVWTVYEQADRAVGKRYLLCPAALTIRHLKKLISSKLDVTPDYQVRLLFPAVVCFLSSPEACP